MTMFGYNLHARRREYILQTCDEYGRWKINDNNHLTFRKNVSVQVHAHKTDAIVAGYGSTTLGEVEIFSV